MTNYYERLPLAHEHAETLRSIRAVAFYRGTEIAFIKSGMALVQMGTLEAVVKFPRRLSHCSVFWDALDDINSRHHRQRISGGIHQQSISRMVKPEILLSWEDWVVQHGTANLMQSLE